jgi:hypothetical protein
MIEVAPYAGTLIGVGMALVFLAIVVFCTWEIRSQEWINGNKDV